MRVNHIPSSRIIDCIQLEESQLLCMLNDNVCSLKISSHKFRFVNSELPLLISQLKNQAADNASQLPLLCTLLVREISEGRTIVETKVDEQVIVIASKNLAEKIKAGTCVITGKKNKAKKYDEVLTGSERFFKEVATGFEKKLNIFLEQIATKNKEQQEAEKSFLETSKKELDRKIVAESVSPWAFISHLFSRIYTSICTSLTHTVEKISDNIKADAYKQERESRQKHAEIVKKEKRRRHEDHELEYRKEDIARYERTRSARKAEKQS